MPYRVAEIVAICIASVIFGTFLVSFLLHLDIKDSDSQVEDEEDWNDY